MEGLQGISRGFERSWRDCEEFTGVLRDCGGIARNLQGLWRDCEEFTGVLRDCGGIVSIF